METRHLGRLVATTSLATALALVTLVGCGAKQEPTVEDDEGPEKVTEVVNLSGNGAQGAEADAQPELVQTDAFSFEIPAYWAGKVGWMVDYEGFGPTVDVHLASDPKASLAKVLLADGDEPMAMGDIGSHCVGSVANGNGEHVEVWTTNWPWLAVMGSAPDLGVSADELRTLVDLSTGGSLSYDDALAQGADAISMAEADYTGSALAATVAFG